MGSSSAGSILGAAAALLTLGFLGRHGAPKYESLDQTSRIWLDEASARLHAVVEASCANEPEALASYTELESQEANALDRIRRQLGEVKDRLRHAPAQAELLPDPDMLALVHAVEPTNPDPKLLRWVSDRGGEAMAILLGVTHHNPAVKRSYLELEGAGSSAFRQLLYRTASLEHAARASAGN